MSGYPYIRDVGDVRMSVYPGCPYIRDIRDVRMSVYPVCPDVRISAGCPGCPHVRDVWVSEMSARSPRSARPMCQAEDVYVLCHIGTGGSRRGRYDGAPLRCAVGQGTSSEWLTRAGSSSCCYAQRFSAKERCENHNGAASEVDRIE